MTMEIHNDERDWEPGGIYYDGPYYTPEEEDEDYDDCEVEDRDTYEAEHDYDDEEAGRSASSAPPDLPGTGPAEADTFKMPRPVRVRRYIDNEF